jgi:hypothetical protein
MSIGWNPFYQNKEKTAEPWILHDFDKVCMHPHLLHDFLASIVMMLLQMLHQLSSLENRCTIGCLL